MTVATSSNDIKISSNSSPSQTDKRIKTALNTENDMHMKITSNTEPAFHNVITNSKTITLLDNPIIAIKCCDKEVRKYYEQYEKKYDTDSGTDLFLPCDVILEKEVTRIDLKVQIAVFADKEMKTSLPWQVVPRSSIANTGARLSNTIGIIDPDYRGNIMINLDRYPYNKMSTLQAGQRIVQAINYHGMPMKMILVDELDTTERGANGFGSTGK